MPYYPWRRPLRPRQMRVLTLKCLVRIWLSHAIASHVDHFQGTKRNCNLFSSCVFPSKPRHTITQVITMPTAPWNPWHMVAWACLFAGVIQMPHSTLPPESSISPPTAPQKPWHMDAWVWMCFRRPLWIRRAERQGEVPVSCLGYKRQVSDAQSAPGDR